eukprot:755279-Pyramimonas_sp.AAC.1
MLTEARTLRKRLRRSQAMAPIAQEMGYLESELEPLPTWTTGRGWQMIALPALPSAGVLPAAGGAISVRSQC